MYRRGALNRGIAIGLFYIARAIVTEVKCFETTVEYLKFRINIIGCDMSDEDENSALLQLSLICTAQTIAREEM